MVNTNYITISKEGLTSTIYVTESHLNLDNKLFLITPPTAPASQATGPATPKVIDLLRITQTYRIRGHIISTTLSDAYTQINTLRTIAKGANGTGGSCTVEVEPDNPDSDYRSIHGFIEKLTITRRPQDIDSTKTYSDDTVFFDIDMSVTWGLAVGEQ
jgi:hypothetical protein